MSIDRKMTVQSHPNIHADYSARNLDVYVSEPTEGTNEQTGICLFIAGYGGHAESNVYRKMQQDDASSQADCPQFTYL